MSTSKSKGILAILLAAFMVLTTTNVAEAQNGRRDRTEQRQDRQERQENRRADRAARRAARNAPAPAPAPEPAPAPAPAPEDDTRTVVLFNGANLQDTLLEDIYIVPSSFGTDGSTATISFINAPQAINGEAIPEDTLDLSRVDANSTVAGDQAFVLVDQFTGTPGELIAPTRDIQNETNNGPVRVRGDIDGDGAADFEITAFTAFGTGLAGPWDDNLIL